MSTIARGLIVWGILVAWASPGSAQSGYVYHVPDAGGSPGSTVTTSMRLDITAAPIEGWSFGVCHEPTLVTMVSAELGADAAATNPAFVSVDQFPDGVAVGVVISFLPPFATLDPGLDLEILTMDYTLDGPGGTITAVSPCATLGSPPVAVIVVANTTEIVPEQVPGALEIFAGPRFIRGDPNHDGTTNILDAVRILELLFQGIDPITCADAVDTNDDGFTNLVDVIFLLEYLFANGPMLPAPFLVCGVDPTDGDFSDCSIEPAGCQ